MWFYLSWASHQIGAGAAEGLDALIFPELARGELLWLSEPPL